MPGRFDYVKFDAEAQRRMAWMKEHFGVLADNVEKLPDGRARALALTAMEEAYMWIGKAIRDEQVANRVAPLQEERKDG